MTTSSSPFILTKYYENGNLSDYLHDGQNVLPLKEKIRLASEIAQGMAYLHSFQPPLVHRNLKCLNILLDKKLAIKIDNFNNCIQSQEIPNEKMVGTPYYMAPEIIKGENKTEKVDIFSFAIVFWEILTQNFPHANHRPYEVIQKIMTDSIFRPEIPTSFNISIIELLNACWNEDPVKRPDFESITKLFSDIYLEI